MSRQPNCTAADYNQIIPECTNHTANTGQLPNAGSKPIHCQQRWYNIEPGFQIPSRPLAIGPLFLLWANQVDTKVAHIANV